MSEPVKNKKSPLFTIFILLTITGATAFWYYALYAPKSYEDFNDAAIFGIPQDQANFNSYNLEIDADIGSFYLDLLPDSSSDVLNIEWQGQYLVDSENDAELPLNIAIENYTVNDSIYFVVTVDHHDSELIKIINLEVFMHISPDFGSYSFSGDLSVGSIYVNMNEINITDMNFHTQTGSFHASLTETLISGDLSLESEVGSVELDLENVDFQKEPFITLSSSVGSIEIDWYQENSFSSNVSFYCGTETGSIEFNVQIVENLSNFDVFGDTSTGSVDIDIDDSIYVSENHYQSVNSWQNSLPITFIEATTSVGSVDVQVELF